MLKIFNLSCPKRRSNPPKNIYRKYFSKAINYSLGDQNLGIHTVGWNCQLSERNSVMCLLRHNPQFEKFISIYAAFRWRSMDFTEFEQNNGISAIFRANLVEPEDTISIYHMQIAEFWSCEPKEGTQKCGGSIRGPQFVDIFVFNRKSPSHKKAKVRLKSFLPKIALWKVEAPRKNYVKKSLPLWKVKKRKLPSQKNKQ